MPFPEGKLVHDYVFEPARMKWGAWLDRLEQKPVADSDADYSSIIVPTGKSWQSIGICMQGVFVTTCKQAPCSHSADLPT